jgi:hypothetical protein
MFLTVRHRPGWISSICVWARIRLDDYVVYVSATLNGSPENVVINEVSALLKLCRVDLLYQI